MSETPAAHTAAPAARARIDTTSERHLPWYHLALTGLASAVLAAIILLALGKLSIAGVVVLGYLLHLIIGFAYSRVREGRRWATDRFVSLLVFGAFGLALIPLVSLLMEVIVRGAPRLVAPGFLTGDMAGVIGGMDAGGIWHAIVGTLLVTFWASVISVPIGLFTAIFLVEYARTGWMKVLGKGITFLVDVMTGIPSIVAGLFGLALFVTVTSNPGIRIGMMGAVALSLLMIPTVVRSSEEMIRLVPMDLREASYALGVPKWLTIVRVVLRTAIAGLTTSVTLAVARVIGETAPLLLTVGALPLLNTNMVSGRMQTLPTFINSQYKLGNAVCNSDTLTNPITGIEHACSVAINFDRAWAAALVLIMIVMVLNIVARLVSYFFAPKSGR
ncbi:phosphate ABC transporter permease PstA [Brachybacterium nesterenkovii]|uniref:Phosphate transport system permease protein PstA n=1 Tax=Brachybacterium nesterenkovii TaxID=47847 RepID=A0A1X6X208_9MICO|nr:phosphate ABC transporter permease PstA [Brachybacterium nesterenkovii]SLM92750.1 Phosphate transport system permease protein PstA (TC 3.A.1.7.1) [Brachybacterium nesterenkovii]